MRKFALIAVITLILAVAALLIAPQFIPADVYREQVTHKVEATTGRKMTINGDISLRFLPRVQLTLQDVSLGNPAGFGDKEPMMTLHELRISLGLLDLLQGRVVIDRFNLVDPVIRLARNAKGEPNWEFTPKADEASSDAGEKEASAGFEGDVQLPNLDIRNGTLSYRESPNAEEISLSQFNASLQLPSLTRPMSLKAETMWNGDFPLELNATITSPADWLNGRETAYDLRFSGGRSLAVLTARGKAQPRDDKTPAAEGEAHLAVESLKKLGKALDMELMPETMTGEGELSLRGMFNYADPQVKLPGFSMTLDALTVSGDGAVRLDGARPHITANLSTESPVVLDDFIPRDKPSVKAPAEEPPASVQGWSDEPLMADTSALKSVDADVKLRVGGLKMDKMEFGAMELAATLRNGALDAQVPDFAFYGGKAALKATVRATGPGTLALSKNVSIREADIGQFLKDAYGSDRLSGHGNLQLALTTQGASMRDLMRKLNGNGALSLQNGAIRGFNLAQTIREARTLVQNVKQKDFTADMRSNASEGLKTDFASLSGSFTVTDGLVDNRDLDLKAQLLTVTGAGTVNLPERTVDYRLKPVLVGTLEGEGRTQESSGSLAIPMRVTGSFDRLKFTPDAGGLVQDALKDPKGTVENLEQNLKGLGKDVKSLFKGF